MVDNPDDLWPEHYTWPPERGIGIGPCLVSAIALATLTVGWIAGIWALIAIIT